MSVCVDPTLVRMAELELALELLVKLQSHYAKLLNMHDGGKRHAFANRQEWIERLRETGDLPGSESALSELPHRAVEAAKLLIASRDAFRSYEHGNSSPELAQEMAAAIERFLEL